MATNSSTYMSLDASPDNTKVYRIMTHFDDFLASVKAQRNDSIESMCSIQSNESKKRKHAVSATSSSLNELSLKMEIKKLEREQDSAEKAHSKAKIDFQRKHEMLTLENKQLKERCENVQLKNHQLSKQMIELHDLLQTTTSDKDKQLQKLQNDFLHLSKLKQENDEDRTDELATLLEDNNRLKSENHSLQFQFNKVKVDLEETSSHMERFKASASEHAAIGKKYEEAMVELSEAKQKIRELTMRLDDAEHAETIAHAFKEDMHRLRDLQSLVSSIFEENAALKENRENNALLSEQLVATRAKLERAEERCADVAALRCENNALSKQLESADELKLKLNSLLELKSQVTELHELNSSLEAINRQLRSELLASEKERKLEHAEIATLKQSLREQKESGSSLHVQLVRLRKHAQLIKHERDSLRQILQTYDADITTTSHTNQLQKRVDSLTLTNDKLHGHVQHLEEQLRAVPQVTAVKTEVMDASTATDRPIVEELESQQLLTSQLQEENAEQQAQIENLLEKVERLEAWIEQRKLQGDYNPEDTKVIHFSMNPHDLARQTAKVEAAELRDECRRLKQKLQELQQGHEVSMSEVEMSRQAKDQLHRAELRNQRLKEVFGKKIQQFRQACYTLTGYQIDSSADSKFKLVSMYAESDSNYLLFQMQTDGSMELLETEYSRTLGELITLHLHHQNSIPMFLAAISADLFSQQTMLVE